jgi:uncharacterized protein YbjT (DUF2867 family)
MKILLSGATGFIGGRLDPLLVDAGHDVVAMTREPDSYDGPGTPAFGDTDDQASLEQAMRGCQVAYYLVHGLDEGAGFGDSDATAARAFGAAAAASGVAQIIYLGGLGREGDDLSEHLASRQEVEGRLGESGVPVTALRAALVIGKGSASFEMLRQLVARLPVVVIPPEAGDTKVQPIAAQDVLRYLVGVLGLPAAVNTVLEVGGPEVMTYEDMLHRMAQKLGKDTPGLKIPVLPALAAKVGVRVLTDVDPQLAVSLLDSLGNDVVVHDDTITSLLPGELLDFDAMIDVALAE